jgi:hypothetical protein
VVLKLCIISECVFYGSRGNVVGITTAYGLDDRGAGVQVPVGSRIFYFSTSSRPALESTQRQGREAENVDLYIHSPILLHGVVSNELRTGALPFLYVFML